MNKIKQLDANTFRIECVQEPGTYDKLHIYFGNFNTKEEEVFVLNHISLPVKMALMLSHDLEAVCADYQHETGNNIGIPDDICEKIVKGE